MKQLLEFYRSTPIKSRQKNAEVYFLCPIPVNEKLEAQFEQEAEANSKDHRPYYNNPLTDVTVRPLVSSGDERKCMEEQGMVKY